MENNENESYEEAYTKFNLTLIYNNTNFTVKVNNNKPIVSIREIAYNIFYPINGKIQLIYRNKDLTPFEQIPIIQYFKNLNKATIIIKPLLLNELKPNSNSPTGNNSFNVNENDMSIFEKTQLGKVNQTQIIDLETTDKNRMMCVDCKKNFIYYYCRNCNCFLCKNCKERYDSFHFNHKSCLINPENITECIRTYIKTLHEEMGNLKRDFERFEKENKNVTLRETEEWKEETLSKLNQLAEYTHKIEEETRINGEAIRDNFDAKETVQNMYNQLLNTNPEKSKNVEKSFGVLKKIDDEIKNVSEKIDECINLEAKKIKVDKIFTPLNAKLDEIIKKLIPEEKNE